MPVASLVEGETAPVEHLARFDRVGDTVSIFSHPHFHSEFSNESIVRVSLRI